MSFARSLKPAAALSALFMAGCAVGPQFRPPAAPAGADYAAKPLPASTVSADGPQGDAQQFVRGMDIPGQWWTLFHSKALNAAIEQALKANPSIAAAQASLRAAHEDMLSERGSLLPSLTASTSSSEIRTATGALAPTSASGRPQYSLFTGQVGVTYSVDVFGLNRRRIESVVASADMQRFELEAAYVSLATNVVMAATQEAGASAQLAAQQDIVRTDTEIRDLLRRQYQLGDAAQSDLVQQEALLAQARSMLPGLEMRVAREHNALIALLGGFPNQELTAPFDLDSLQLPQDLPVSLPSRLVRQRPDILAAEAGLHSASAQVGVAVAERLPQINLTADLGGATTALAGPFMPYSQFFNVAGGLAQPLFAGGKLVHHEKAARARLDAAQAVYRGTVINAFRDVSDTLHAIQSDAETLKASEDAEAAAAKSLSMARAQLKLGDGSTLYVLEAERRYAAARQALVQAQVARLSDTAALFQALGGGWWNRQAGVETASSSADGPQG
ncbi:MAG TPA: efflux transporter outer membrane subunit [Caulobacteraceae bacterium]|jgi:NodT family efflux transporter outer membrane factor (OMF) lipoprotein